MNRYFVRLQPFYNVAQFQTQRVAIFGVGSGGSMMAEALVKCGLTQLTLVDHDRLQAPNVARHLCGAADLRRPKVDAVADYLHRRNPAVQPDRHYFDMRTDPERVAQLVAAADLSIAATDNQATRQMVGDLVQRYHKIGVFPGVFERASGGQVIMTHPDQPTWPDYFTALRQLGQYQARQYRRRARCHTRTPLRNLKAEPGLGLDIDIVALLAAKLTLGLLLGPTHPLFPPAPYYLWNATDPTSFLLPLSGAFYQLSTAGTDPEPPPELTPATVVDDHA